MARIAFFGLGGMGRGMAGRLLAAGHEVRLWNRTLERMAPLVAQGGIATASPAAAAEGAEAAFSMVADDEASRRVWLAADGALAALQPGALAIECATLSAGWVAELARAAAGRGLAYIDAPVTGLPEAAAAGRLTLLVGAEPAELARARPLLERLGSDIFHFGRVGAGTAYKLTVNLMGAVQIAGVAEGLAMAKAAGLDLAQVAEALAVGQAASPQVVRTAGRIVAGDHGESIVFSGRMRLKDASYGVALAERLDIEPALGRTAAALYRRMVEAGLGEINDSGVVRLYEAADGSD